MAKISARGDREVARWCKGEAVMVLTEQGRLLVRYLRGDGYSIMQRRMTYLAAAALAARLGYVAA